MGQLGQNFSVIRRRLSTEDDHSPRPTCSIEILWSTINWPNQLFGSWCSSLTELCRAAMCTMWTLLLLAALATATPITIFQQTGRFPESPGGPRLSVGSVAGPQIPMRTLQGSGATVADHNYMVVCYYGSWAVYRPEPGKFPVESIDPNICTHLIYGFAGLSYDGRIRSLDSYNDLRENYGKGAFERFTGLKRQNPRLRTLMAIGGWNEGSVKYSKMAASPEGRRQFAKSAVEFLERYGFDGLDMDWEYPANRGGKPEDKQNFVLLLRPRQDWGTFDTEDPSVDAKDATVQVDNKTKCRESIDKIQIFKNCSDIDFYRVMEFLIR
ncbi:Cht9 [Cordylochernes scorpioides]|uniref:Cht9 n=1 Tax=Cordylochernes scorpioides TaxID=51811 RepID=A0ABY6K1P5_9ARAC|nr:Cht9 [Cordylochernes scorpioides]